MATKQEKMEAFGQLLDILDELRVKCPWDRKQTNESLRTNTIEETYELCDAIMKDDNNNIKKELGDLLLHIVFYAKIGEEKAAFDIKDVCDSLCQKLIYRHPQIHPNNICGILFIMKYIILKIMSLIRNRNDIVKFPFFVRFVCTGNNSCV